MGARMEVQMVVEFGEGGNGGELIRSGWSNAERGFRWMVGFESIMSLPRAQARGTYQLSFSVRPHVRPPRLPKQALIIAVNDVIVSVTELVRATTVECEVPWHAVELAEETTLRLIHPHAMSPHDIAELPDVRLLAVAAERLEIRIASALPVDPPDDQANAADPPALERERRRWTPPGAQRGRTAGPADPPGRTLTGGAG
jgi:hypothetical protein